MWLSSRYERDRCQRRLAPVRTIYTLQFHREHLALAKPADTAVANKQRIDWGTSYWRPLAA